MLYIKMPINKPTMSKMRRRIISHLYRRQMIYFSVLNGDVNHRNEVAGRLVTNESWSINDLPAQTPITEGLSRGKVSYFSTSTSLKKDRHAVERISTKNLKVKTKVIGQSETRKHNEEPIEANTSKLPSLLIQGSSFASNWKRDGTSFRWISFDTQLKIALWAVYLCCKHSLLSTLTQVLAELGACSGHLVLVPRALLLPPIPGVTQWSSQLYPAITMRENITAEILSTMNVFRGDPSVWYNDESLFRKLRNCTTIWFWIKQFEKISYS